MKHLLRIAIDGNEANVAHRVGSNIYAYELLVALEKITRVNDEVEVSILLAGEAVKSLPRTRKGWQYQVIPPSLLWTQLALPSYLYLHQNDFDVFFTPGHYAPRLSKIPYVSSVMDLGFLKFPHQFKSKDLIQLRDWTEYSVKHAAKVIAISEFTKKDVVTTYDKAESDVVVAYPNIDLTVHPLTKEAAEKVLKKYKITLPYLLYVGTLQPRKNLVRLIEAFERVQRVITNSQREVKFRSKYELRPMNPYKDIQLVIAGKTGWLADEIMEKIESSPLRDHIVVTGFVDDMTKNALYQGASGSALVGLYEGFGIPPLESLEHGVIPVVSNNSSLPEVVGKAGILVDPNSVPSIANGLLTVLLLSARERARLRREGRKQLKDFNWEKSAQIVLDTLSQVVDSQ